MRLIFLAFLTGLISSIKAQTLHSLNPVFNNTDPALGVFIGSQLDANSNGISNSFASNFIWPDNIKNDEIDRQLKSLPKNNRVGAEFENELSFYNTINEIKYSLNYRNRLIGNIGFTRPLFRIIFDGTSNLEGGEYALHPAAFNYLNYHSVGFTAIKEMRKSPGLHLGIEAHYVMGSQYSNFKTDEGSLFYSGSFDSLSLNTDAIAEISSFENNSYFAPNAHGFSLGLIGNYQIKNFNFRFQLTDLGLLFFSDEVTQYRYWVQQSYSGLLIASDNSIEEQISDIENDLEPDSSSVNSTLLPFTIQLSSFHQLKDYVIHYNLRYVNIPRFFPEISIRGSRIINENIEAGVNLGYGGFGGINMGIQGKLRTEKIDIQLEVRQLADMIIGKAPLTGFQLGLGVNYRIKT